MMSSTMRHDSKDDGDRHSEDESSSSSFEDDRHGHRRQRDKKSKKRKKSNNKRSRRERHHKDSKHDKRKSDKKKHGKKRRRHHRDDDASVSSSRDDDNSGSDSIGASSIDDESRDKKKKMHRRRNESSSKKHKKKKRKRRHNEKDDDESTTKRASKNTGDDDHDDPIKKRNRTIVSALSDLLKDHPLFSEELPVLLIRLAGGTTFDLRQMNDIVAAQALSKVLESLEVFGVTRRKEDGMWMFSSGGGSNNKGASDPLILLKLIRACMDDVGISMKAIEDYEKKETKKIEQQKQVSTSTTKNDQKDEQPNKKIKDLTIQVLADFSKDDSQLGFQLADLCKQIAQGECVSIDGIPDANLESRLESIFVDVGLEKSEMIFDDDSSDGDDDDDDDNNNVDDSNNEKVMGFGLPDEDGDNDIVQLKLAAIMEACRSPLPEKKKRVLGPMRGPPPGQTVAATAGISDEDEGPLLPGAAPRRPIMAPEDIRAQAERRELELKATAAGVSIPVSGGREEWMIVPGKHDFLSNIKAGQSIKSRQFQNKKVRGGNGNNGGDGEDAPIHPAIRAEMEAIKRAHEEARGPSLIEQHRAKKKQEKEEAAAAAAASGKKKAWGWNRETDLDAGRRVDKDALHMVLGGAADNLKTKFQGGF